MPHLPAVEIFDERPPYFPVFVAHVEFARADHFADCVPLSTDLSTYLVETKDLAAVGCSFKVNPCAFLRATHGRHLT